MLSLVNFLKQKTVTFERSSLELGYSAKDLLLSIDHPSSGALINVPIDAQGLELVKFINHTLDEARSGNLSLNAWENPEVKDLDKRVHACEQIAIGYYIILTFMCQCTTRDIWKIFPKFHRSLLSFLRNRAITTQMLMRYKIAILTCVVQGYGLTDLLKIEKVFKRCGLSSENYIFYVLVLLDGYADTIKIDNQEAFVLSVNAIEEETSRFMDHPSTMKYCLHQAHTKLSFIFGSQRSTAADMANELAISTQIAYTTIRPFKSRAYSENYARRAMTNTALRIIHAYTKYEQNIRLRESKEGSENTHRMISDFMTMKDINPLYASEALSSSMSFNEDRMIDYLDSRRH